MKLILAAATGFCLAILIGSTSNGQTLARSPESSQTAAKLEQLSKKIDQQNAKIDVLSQQILKLQQQISKVRPGVMIGEGATPSISGNTVAVETPPPQAGGSHIVARGETLTSIAKMHNVSVGELQRYNHIENDRKLQIGQTLLIPGAAPAATTPQSSPGQ